jgi:hypothetical protein
MSVAAANGAQATVKEWNYDKKFRLIRLDITGLAAGANTIPHGIIHIHGSGGIAPFKEDPLATSAISFHQTQAGDATNLYYTVDSGAGTTMSVWCWFRD